MNTRDYILITGGAGYIGVHLTLYLLETTKYSIIVVDNLSTTDMHNINALKELYGNPRFCFYKIPLQLTTQLQFIFSHHKIKCVIHLAGYKSVKESIQKPLKYYNNNINATLSLLEVMKGNNVDKIIFSSTALVYGNSHRLPVTEHHLIQASDPYSRSKYMIEKIIEDAGVKAIILRYFNPIGHNPIFKPEEGDYLYPNLLNTISEGKAFHIYGNDWPTKDGTCVRDFIHIDDLVESHSSAMANLLELEIEGSSNMFKVYNIGIGTGSSIKELVSALLKAGCNINVISDEKREGDLAEYYANVTYANMDLGWAAKYNSIEKIMEKIVSDIK